MPDQSRKELQLSRNRLSHLVVRAMRRDGFDELTSWIDYHGISRSTFYSLMRGRETKSGSWTKPSLDTLISLARALDVPLADLVYVIVPDAPGAGSAKRADEIPMLRSIPVTRIAVQVAGWVGAGPDQSEEINGESVYVEAAFAHGKKLRAFRVRGDSMAAGRKPIYDGDMVIVNTADPGHNTASVVARLHNDAYVCKVLKDDQYGRLLQSRNVDHTNGTPSAIPIEDVAEIVGRVVRTIHDEA